MPRKIIAADLFCGAGGTSTGLLAACEAAGVPLQLVAVNHWDIAISTHAKNHPHAEHLCSNLDNVDPRKLVQGGVLDLLVASPECTHHSVARGGKPINDQSRASAWRVVEWCSQITVNHVLIENVKEFRTWGPLGSNGRPLKRRKGETYQAFLNALRALGYTVEDRVLNAADFGDPTSRERLFIQAWRGRKPIQWPAATHGPRIEPAAAVLFEKAPAPRRPYRTAREIIDWSIPGESIFRRKRPLSPNTMNRIYKGLIKFAGLPFIVPQLSGGANRGLDQPIPTITTTSRGIGFCEPFIIAMEHGGHVRSIDRPLNTITTARGGAHGVCMPYLIRFNGSHRGRQDGAGRGQSIDQPLSTLDTSNRLGLVQPFIVPTNHGKDGRSHDIDRPMPVITTVDAWALIEPYLVKYNGTGGPMPVSEPLDTVTAKDRFGLVEPMLAEEQGSYAILDIRFRMLQPHELAAAMSFPKSYHFVGNREQKVKQIGNAVPVQLAKALCSEIVSHWRQAA